MKKEGRVRLILTKRLQNGNIESFMVIVSEKDEQAAVSAYKSRGYSVIKA